MAHSVCRAGNHRMQRSLAALQQGRAQAWGAGGFGNLDKSCPKKDLFSKTIYLLLHDCVRPRALSEELTHLMHVFMVLYPQFQIIRLSAISKHSGPLSAVTSPIQHLHLKAPFSHLVKDVEYKTISIQSSAAARSWKANLNLKSQISKQWCLKIFIMESYVVTFSFSCICKVGNHQLIIIDVMLGIWFNN